MNDIIKLLPDSIANQIAAGEVVQRPASVVKELLENAIDAQAKHIQLIVKDAGRTSIQVIDDGIGMTETDARMCFERHATSKIRQANDLFAIRTMGFRGEAMASIAAVAQVELRTRQAQAEIGTMIRIEASDLKAQEPVSTPVGTHIQVKNLFFNVPARRNFLRSNAVEMRHILDEFQHVALAHPEISFTMYQNDLETYNLPAGKLSQRIVNLFGKSYRDQLISCQEGTDYVTITGYIGKPEFSKKTRGEQFFFVNKRFIKHNYLHHAIMTAYEGLLADESYPFYTLFIEIDPAHIDINVHPTKTEIKFDDERAIYAVVQSTIRKALGMHHLSPTLDFDQSTSFMFSTPVTENKNASSHPSSTNLFSNPPKASGSTNSTTSSSEKDNVNFITIESDLRRQNNQKNWSVLYKDFQEAFPKEQVKQEEPEQIVLTLESKVNRLPGDTISSSSERLENEGLAYQMHNSYIVSQVSNGMMLIDQRAAHERILYEKFLNTLSKRNATSQQLLFPKVVELSSPDFELIMEITDEIKHLGFEIGILGRNTIAIQGIPAEIPDGQEKEVLEGLIEQFKWHQSELNLGRRENIARSLAKRSAIKHGHKLTIIEMQTLITQLFASSNPNYAPDGTPTLVILTLDKIGSFFTK
ncbi:DNA mismatch repair endonuclease MutL [Cytophagaceae bacterium DM2B3-1]|uniref:DNA mismatch repair protein MutL n=1 Tax=Xanthocytophaga flava TaxID=3048013 RepID=A0ABT7CE35_9BACT|nr:DNA mismatch repair endonuclease MutL [Xanthocytophaga flavus]MDJ1491317.1 DNA mismatch repair endonuclease MutL [Xanthocytophaga flavus]